MGFSDPIADLLTRIRNGGRAQRRWVEVCRSKMNLAIVKILHQQGFLEGFLVDDRKPQGVIRVYLRYGSRRRHVINDLQRVSRPGRRLYRGCDQLPKIFGGMGIAVLSTSRGVMTGKQAKEQGIGGEVLAYVW